ncbi:hypothetical protein Fmac_020629 [Flemingia macrophylla]|uniref:Uncharacterized protein n=1 Tax=Flemingia macrophylla TaxID=520843 RepID=A0ABD1LUJ6_9FABA
MGALYISLNHFQSCYKPSSLFNLNVGTSPAVRIRCRRVVSVSACLDVSVDAPNGGKTALGKTKSVMEMEGKVLVGTYERTEVVIVRGEGCKLYDIEGREYLDLNDGIAGNALGHGDADWLKAVVEQAGTLTHTSNMFYTIPQVELAKSCGFFFC